ncbi:MULTISPECIES: hypothetical protein [unclassified Roseitalea]|uniref:hypothetical protein n=1 Tax=unclassified Roseitalea TaxID=2639107 RepID=UPI00273EFCE5|nr:MULTISPECIES: hypothetical protein [unclassified Roseitalea]
MTTKLDPEQARQGRGGRRVLTILIAGLLLAAVGAIVLEVIDNDAVTDNIGAPGVEPVPG